MMMKFNWSMQKTIEYLFSKKMDIVLTDQLIKAFTNIEGQLQAELDKKNEKPKDNSPKKGRLFQDRELRKSWDIDWIHKKDKLKKMQPILKEDEAALINSYKNSLSRSSEKLFVEKLDKKVRGKGPDEGKTMREIMEEAAREAGLNIP